MRLNDIVRVKLTDKGYEVWRESRARMLPPPYCDRDVSFYKAKTLENGYVEFVLWDLFTIFGPVLQTGGCDIIVEIVPVIKHRFTDYDLQQHLN